MHINSAIATSISSSFLGLGIAATGGATENTVMSIAVFGFFVALGLMVRLEPTEPAPPSGLTNGAAREPATGSSPEGATSG